jgi:hypothetical protein
MGESIVAEPERLPKATARRKLGDEWAGWRGEAESPESVRAGWGLFLALLGASAALAVAVGALFLYLVAPRLAQLDPGLPTLLLGAWVAAAVLLAIWLSALLAALRWQRYPFCLCLGNRVFFDLSRWAERLGRRMGIHRDRLGHSFVKVANAVSLSQLRGGPKERVLVLLPRCLSREARKGVMDILSRFQVEVRTAGGGEAAREAVRELEPEVVIGIACERDLVTGIQDVAPQIPVLGIPNIRPQGPCLGTTIDFEELEHILSLVSRPRRVTVAQGSSTQ